MSELMSNVEIEDVLSSIRRLVSEDFRPPARSGTAMVAGEKLILTPALRVVPDETSLLTPSSVLPRLHLGVEPEIETVVATLETAVGDQTIDWESEIGDPAPDGRALEFSSSTRLRRGFATGLKAEEQAEQVLVSSDVEDNLNDVWAQGGGSDDAPNLGDAAALDAHDSDWADDNEAAAIALLENDALATADVQPASGPDVEFDEHMLRDLVRDMIEQELQGGLGERITRNVRKLVRACTAPT